MATDLRIPDTSLRKGDLFLAAGATLLLGGCIGQLLGSTGVSGDARPQDSINSKDFQTWWVEEPASIQAIQTPPKAVVGMGFPIKLKVTIGSSSCNKFKSVSSELLQDTIFISALKSSMRANRSFGCTADVYSQDESLVYTPSTSGVYKIRPRADIEARYSSASVEVQQASSSETEWWVSHPASIQKFELASESIRGVAVNAMAAVNLEGSCQKVESISAKTRDDVRIVYVMATILKKESPIPLGCDNNGHKVESSFEFTPNATGSYQVVAVNAYFGTVAPTAAIVVN